MYQNKTICVVIPAFNEEHQIGQVIDNIPDFVDRIVIVNDASTDNTAKIIEQRIINQNTETLIIPSIFSTPPVRTYFNEAEIKYFEYSKKEISKYAESEIFNSNDERDRIILINLKRNSGNGKAIARGFKWAKDHNIDCTVVMDADGQMDPSEIEKLISPIIYDGVDYVKGNRLIHRSAILIIPKIRFLGNSILSIFTKLASGYWRVSDTQTGFVALSKRALNSIRIYELYKSFGWPNDLLVKMNIALCTVKEVEIKPVYNIGEKSKMKIYKVIPRISFLLLRLFFKRLWVKYLFRDFHPLFLLYHFSFLLGFLSLPYIYKVIKAFITGSVLNYEPLLAFMFLTISSFQSFLFAMWMDIQNNERLYKD